VPITTIVVVEDDTGLRTAIQQFLRSVGHDALTYESAEDFLAATEASCIHCLIADVHLPGMSGVALLVALAESGREVPAVLMTGKDDVPTRALLLQAGDVPCLFKPFRDWEVMDAIERAVWG
jgi:FixJ family two-component response regulator